MKIGFFGFGTAVNLLLLGQYFSNPIAAAIAAALMPLIAASFEVLWDGRRASIMLGLGVALAVTGGLLAVTKDWSINDFGIGFVMALISTGIFAWASRAAVRELPGVSDLGRSAACFVGVILASAILWGVSLVFDLPLSGMTSLPLQGVLVLLYYAFFAIAMPR